MAGITGSKATLGRVRDDKCSAARVAANRRRFIFRRSVGAGRISCAGRTAYFIN